MTLGWGGTYVLRVEPCLCFASSNARAIEWRSATLGVTVMIPTSPLSWTQVVRHRNIHFAKTRPRVESHTDQIPPSKL